MIRIQMTIFCDVCGDWFSTPVASTEKRREMLQLAKQRGWKRKRGTCGWMIDVCSACLQKEVSDARR